MHLKNTPPRRTAEIMLVLATLFWGWTFPVVKEAIAVMPVFAFLAVRFTLATLLMLPLTGIPKRRSLKTGILLGVLLFAAFAFQTLGLEHTSASKCAFITGLNVIWVAIATAHGARSWAAVSLGVSGLWLLTEPAGGLSVGDFLTLLCSFFIAAHILVLDRLTPNCSSGDLAIIQFAITALLCTLVSASFEDDVFPVWDGELIFALLLTAIGATVFSFWAQTHYQRHTTAVRAGVIFILEPVFAACFAVLFYGENPLSATAWIGAGAVLLAMAISTGKKTSSNKQR